MPNTRLIIYRPGTAACILGDVGGDAAGLVMSQQHGQWRISANIPVDCIVDH
jgi:hypothetical protein